MKKNKTKDKYKKYHASRGSWGNVNPITKVITNKKKEKNKKECRRKWR